jgi:hypothetical protein
VRAFLARPWRGESVVINPERRSPERRVHLLDDELDERWWVESADPAGADELLLGAHELLRRTALPAAWRVIVEPTGLHVRWRGELTGHAAEQVADLLVGLAEAASDPVRTPPVAPSRTGDAAR